MSDLCGDACGVRRPVGAGHAGDHRTGWVGSREDVGREGTWGPGPLAVDALTALVEKERGIAGPGMKLVHVVGDQLQAGVVPRPGPDPVPCVSVLVGVRRIPFDAE